MQNYQLISLFLCSLILGSCSQQPDMVNAAHNQAPSLKTFVLPAEINESSGLACLGNRQFLTMNDSGNAAVLYQVDAEGHASKKMPVQGTNTDWEALAIHQNALWIADIGNNSGQRASLQLYKAELPTTSSTEIAVQTFDVRYAQPPTQLPSHFQHELDAEALVSTGDKLLIFSKNWMGLTSRVYQVNTSQPSSLLQQIGQTGILPGLITDAAYSAKHQVFVIAGYQNFKTNPFNLMFSGDFGPFIAILNMQYQVVKSVPIETGGQLEGICLDDKENIWLSQENSARKPALFWHWGELSALLQEMN